MANEVIIKAVRSDGKIFNFNNATWGTVQIDGIDFPKYDIFTKKNAVGDGSIVTAKRIVDRDIKITSRSRNVALNEVNRRLVMSFFNVHYYYKLYIAYQGHQYWIDGECEVPKLPSKNIHYPLDLAVGFNCPDPLFKSVDNFGKDIAAITGKFGFPYIQTADIGVIASVFNFAKTVLIENDGDEETFCTVVINATGSVVNPRIISGDHYVQVNANIEQGDTVVIDCEKLTVSINDVNSLQMVDKNSDFSSMKLQIGDNIIGFDATSGDTNMKVFVYYNKRYMGL